MTCARVHRPSFDDLVSPSTGLPMWVHSQQEFDAAQARIVEVQRQARQWQAQVILAEAVRLFDQHPWLDAFRLDSDGTGDGIVQGVSLRALAAGGAVAIPSGEVRARVQAQASQVFVAICPHADESVWAYVDDWLARGTYLTDLATALGLPSGPDLDAFVVRCRSSW